MLVPHLKISMDTVSGIDNKYRGIVTTIQDTATRAINISPLDMNSRMRIIFNFSLPNFTTFSLL